MHLGKIRERGTPSELKAALGLSATVEDTCFATSPVTL
jgi:hypothetical protein